MQYPIYHNAQTAGTNISIKPTPALILTNAVLTVALRVADTKVTDSPYTVALEELGSRLGFSGEPTRFQKENTV